MLFNNTNMRTAMAYTNAVGDKVYPIIVDIKKGIKSTEEVSFVSSDINTGVLSVAFIQGNDTYNVSGAEVICSVMRPDSSTLEIPCNIVNTNVIEVPLGINGTSQDGVYSFDFKVFKDENKVIGTPIMNYSVSLSIESDNTVEEDDRLPVLTILMTQVNNLKNETEQVISQADDTISLARVATENATQATTVANATINQINQDTANAIDRLDTAVGNVDSKITEVETRFNTLTSSQQQSSEVIDARDGETSLKARLDRDIEKAKQIYVDVEGNYITTDSSDGYLKDVEIKGNTIQDINQTGDLADIRSVGDKVEGQELYKIDVVSCGKNLIDNNLFELGKNINSITGEVNSGSDFKSILKYIPVAPNSSVRLSVKGDLKYQNIICFYNSSFNFISSIVDGETINNSIKVPSNARYLRLRVRSTSYDIQLEEGTVATEYEPYQEDKLTILSPVQLEKVGDVADRIICKDGVWGVEKNINTKVLNGGSGYGYNLASSQPTDTSLINFYVSGVLLDAISKAPIISNRFINIEASQVNCCYAGGSGNIHFVLSRELITDTGVFKAWLNENNTSVKYPLAQPQFIPLPHDQQIKLRTFAGQTNIHFETEIEGAIKARIPKSIGASINTNSQQIANLSNELARVKKLEESTVSTVETESGFTTVEATSNGYFEDVKLEGKTLVNLCGKVLRKVDFISVDGDIVIFNPSQYTGSIEYDVSMLKPNTTYTFINRGIDVRETIRFDLYPDNFTELHKITKENPINVYKFTTPSDINNLRSVRQYVDYGVTDTTKIYKPIILEGDHTQTPPSYFEGLLSAGQDVEEVSVESVNENLFDGEVILNAKFENNGSITQGDNAKGCVIGKNFIKVDSNFRYKLSSNKNFSSYLVCEYDVNKNFICRKGDINNLPISQNCEYVKIYCYSSDSTLDLTDLKIMFSVGTTDKLYKLHKSDKKPLLYFNPTTETWEKPVLRQWDTIEKHSDGKYYYHKRSGELVLNGSETWLFTNAWNSGGETIGFHLNDKTSNGKRPICDRFKFLTPEEGTISSIDKECFCFPLSAWLGIRINKSKLPTQDVAGFKAWLQANPTTVVYQLANEEVYECTNIDLITYADETNYIVNSGAISPKSILKVHNNISNVVKILQEKVSLLEDKFIQGLKQVLAGDMYSLATLLYPEDFETENSIMLLPLE